MTCIEPSTLEQVPIGETIVIILIGVVAATIVFNRRVSHFTNIERSIETLPYGVQHTLCTVEGEPFFASSDDITTRLDYSGDPELVVSDMTRSHA